MAARDRNMFAWQAYVITMTLVSVALLLALGFTLFYMSTNDKKAQDAIAAKNSAEENLRKSNEKLQLFELMLGTKTDTDAVFQDIRGRLKEELDPINKKFDADMSLFGPDIAPQERNYSKLVQVLMSALRDRNLQHDSNNKKLAQLNDEVNKIRIQETSARKIAEDARAKLEQELTGARQKFTEDAAEMQKKIDEVKDALTNNSNKAEAEKKKLSGEIARLTSENKSLVEFKKEMMTRIETTEEREDFESAQAVVTHADPRSVQVSIDLGKKDGLRPGLRFSILNQNTIRISEATPKAQIEITQVYPDSAIGKVIQDKLSIPVIRGDLVYSPMFKRGGKLKVALLGRMDVDGNGSDDRDIVKNLIEQNGGEVVEDLGPSDIKSRVLVGKGIDVYTRYLVVGDEIRGSNDPRQATQLSAFADVQKRAKEYNVTQISLDRFLGYLQKNDSDRVIPLGEATRPLDFRPNERVNQPNYLYNDFKERRPGSTSPQSGR